MISNDSKQQCWAVLIGVNGYHESLGRLNFCVNDVMLLHETLTSDCCGFSPENIVTLTDDQEKDRVPTFGNIHSWLGTWLARPGPDDLVLIYFAGHGREANSEALLAPLDATLDSMPVTGIAVPYITGLLERCAAARKVLILDACHSGAGRDVATMSNGFRTAIDAGKGIYTIASCDADQISHEWPEKEQGVFTHYLIEALRHGAPVGVDGRVTLDAVYENARAAILAWTSERRLKQEPVRICRTKGDIHIAARPLSVEQQLTALKSLDCAQEQIIARLRQELAQQVEENASLREPASKPEMPGDKAFVPKVPSSWWAICRQPLDNRFDKLAVATARGTPTGSITINTVSGKKGQDWDDVDMHESHGMFVRYLTERGFHIVAEKGEASIELRFLSGESEPVVTVTEQQTGMTLWKGRI